MKQLLLLTITTFFLNNTQAQCNIAIPNTANVINTNMNTLSTGDAWICSNLLATDNGDASNIYLEANSDLNCFGCTSTIWAKSGCTVNIFSNGTPTIYAVSGANILDVSGMATIDSCGAIVYDYTNSPANGCSVVSSNFEHEALTQFNIYPNPSNDLIYINAAQPFVNASVKFFALDGRLVQNMNAFNSEQSIDISRLNSGYYTVVLTNLDKSITLTSNLIIQ